MSGSISIFIVVVDFAIAAVTGESGLFIFCLLILFCSGRRDPVECLLQHLLVAAERDADVVPPFRAEDGTWSDEDP